MPDAGGQNVEDGKNGAFEMERDNTAPHMKMVERTESILRNPQFRRGYIAAAATMCLGIMGGAILPLPLAYSITGIVAATLIALLVGIANVITSDLLIRQCYKSGASDYEEIGYAVGGKAWMVFTQLSIVVLMLGAIIASMKQIGEAATTALTTVWPETVPDWLLYKDGSGWVPLVAITALITFPLCMVKQMRMLEYAGFAGFFIVMWLVVVVVVQSIGNGLPALGDGQVRKVGFTSLEDISTVMSILGYAFFIQPMMMPLLAEMPGKPRHQARILSWAMRFAVIGFALVVYVITGFFGASWYGQSTEGNILQNRLMGGGTAQGILNMFMTLFLALSLPPLEYPTRLILNNWLPGDKKKLPAVRHVVLTSFILIVSLAVAIFWQAGSDKLLVVTAATGVFLCSYVIPVINHFALYYNMAKCQHEANLKFKEETGLSDHSHYGGHPVAKFIDSQGVPLSEALPPMENFGKPGVLTYRRELPGRFPYGIEFAIEYMKEIMLPLLIMLLGAFTSGVSLWATFK